jgi:hypothetical protein
MPRFAMKRASAAVLLNGRSNCAMAIGMKCAELLSSPLRPVIGSIRDAISTVSTPE